jgi:Tol biopolymer transport system component/regulator of sirC expression with transglutaminase-like and TPR domain
LFRGSGTTISGSIQKYGSTIRIVARKVTNGELKNEWVVTKEKMESDEDILDLIQDLAFQMAWDLNKVGAQSWQSFKDFTEGLRSYQKYRSTKNPAYAQEAIEKYRAALSKQPTYPIVRYNLGVVYSNLDQLDEALQEYEQAAKEDPTLIGAFYNAGFIYLKRTPEDYDKAINMFGEVITKTAELDNLEYQRYRTLAYGGRAWAYVHKYDEGKDEALLQQAMADSEEALNLDPNLAQALGAKGRVLDLQEEYAQAIEQYAKAIGEDPSYHEIYYFRGYLYTNMDEKEAARSDLTRYLELVPNAPDREEIEDQLQRLGEEPTVVPSPVTPQDYYERALAHFELEEYPSALDDFTRVISMTIDLPKEREYADAYYKRGAIYQAQKDDKAAIKDYNRYLELVPDALEKEQLEEYIATTTGTPVPSTAEDYYTRGIQRLDAEEYELVLEDLNQALALEPDLVIAYYARGKVHRLLDHAEAATSDFRRYLELAPDAPDRAQVEAWIGELVGGISPTVTPSPPVPTPPPQGKIAFVSRRDGNEEIYVMKADGSDQTRLTDHPFGDWRPAWSPDGRKIVFTSIREDDIANQIYVMAADGSNVVKLSNNLGDDRDPAWALDGTRIAFVSRRDGNPEIYVMNESGGNQTRLTENAADDLHPSWSPDGTKIAFQSNREGANHEIYIMNLDGSGLVNITNNPADDGHPHWAPDGIRIVFASNRDGNYEIYVMDVAGGDLIRLTYDPAWDGWPTWSPNNSKIAFTSTRDGNEEIYVISVDGSNLIRLTNRSALDGLPAWSPVEP